MCFSSPVFEEPVLPLHLWSLLISAEDSVLWLQSKPAPSEANCILLPFEWSWFFFGLAQPCRGKDGWQNWGGILYKGWTIWKVIILLAVHPVPRTWCLTLGWNWGSVGVLLMLDWTAPKNKELRPLHVTDKGTTGTIMLSPPKVLINMGTSSPTLWPGHLSDSALSKEWVVQCLQPQFSVEQFRIISTLTCFSC